MWSIVLMGLAGLLVGGALSFRQQKKPLWTQIAFYVLAGMSLLAAYLLTLPGLTLTGLHGHSPTTRRLLNAHEN